MEEIKRVSFLSYFGNGKINTIASVISGLLLLSGTLTLAGYGGFLLQYIGVNDFNFIFFIFGLATLPFALRSNKWGSIIGIVALIPPALLAHRFFGNHVDQATKTLLNEGGMIKEELEANSVYFINAMMVYPGLAILYSLASIPRSLWLKFLTPGSNEPLLIAPKPFKPLSQETKRLILKSFKILIPVAIICTVSYFGLSTYMEHRQIEKNDLNNESSRLAEIKQNINESIAKPDYNQALVWINYFRWELYPKKYPENVQQIDKEREQFKTLILELKHQSDSLEVINKLRVKSQQQQAEEQFNKDNLEAHTPSSYPFIAMVSSKKCYIYAEPNVNAERKTELVQETTLNIMSSQNEFFFCTYQTSDGKSESGWVYYNDVVR